MRRADVGRAILLAVLTLGTACQPKRTPTDDSAAPASPSNVITNEELTQAGLLGSTAFEAVQQLRPRFFIDRMAGAARRTSSQPIQVSVNGGQMGPISALNSIPSSTVAEIRYLSVGEATQRFGGRATGPVILVVLMTR